MPASRHRKQLDQAAARRRRRANLPTTWHGEPAADVAMLPAWCAEPSDLDEAKTATHDGLIALMGAHRRGPISWRIFDGDEALAAMDSYLDLLPLGERNREHLDYLNEIRRRLADIGGLLVVAQAAGEAA